MKLEEGMYVRTTLGNIGKIVEEYTHSNYKVSYPEPQEWVLDTGYVLNEALMYNNEDITKASYNIIDLIEVGDVIKFDITDTDNYADIQGYNCWEISCEEELNRVKEMIEMESAKLISIVTKEQFSQMEYRLGD